MDFDTETLVRDAIKSWLNAEEITEANLKEFFSDEFGCVEVEMFLQEQLDYFASGVVLEKLQKCSTIDELVIIADKVKEGVRNSQVKLISEVKDDDPFKEQNYVGNIFET